MNFILRILKVFFVTNIILFTIVVIKIYPNVNLQTINNLLCNYDCNWYVNISTEGYIFKEGAQSNTAFFPLFSLLIRLFSNNLLITALINQFLFSTSFVLITSHLKINAITQLKYLATGLIIFHLIPYSESLFFVGSSLLLYSLNKRNKLLLMLGVFIACTSRSASLIFIVAFILLLIESIYNKRKEYISIYILAIFTVLACTLMIFYYQYLQTSELNSYFKSQVYWKHTLRIPTFPFKTWGWLTNVTDISALIIGLISTYQIIKYVYTINNRIEYNSSYLFSILYLSGITFSILLFQGGDLHSINRYIFSSVFFLVFISHEKTMYKPPVYLIPSIILISLFVINGFKFIEHYIIYLTIVFIYLNIIFTKVESRKWLYSGLIILYVFQIILLVNYLDGHWIG